MSALADIGAAAPPRRAWLTRRGPAFWFLLPAVGVLFVLTLFPTVHLLFASFRHWSLLAPGIGTWAGLQNYVDLLTDSRMLHAFGNTLFFTVCGVTTELILGIGVAHLLARSMPGITLARGLMLLPMVTTPIVVGLSWRMLYDPNFGQINWALEALGLPAPAWLTDAGFAMPALILTDVWEWTPFVALILLAGLQSIPHDLYEAAAIDGAGPVARFRAITLPMLRPLIMIAILFRTMDSLRWFDTIYVMTNGGPGTTTETANLYGYIVSFNNADVGFGSAIAVVILVIVLAVSKVLVNKSGLEDEA